FDVLAEPTADFVVDHLIPQVVGERVGEQPYSGEAQVSGRHFVVQRLIILRLFMQEPTCQQDIPPLEGGLRANTFGLLVRLPALDLHEPMFQMSPCVTEGSSESIEREASALLQNPRGRLMSHSSGMSFSAAISVARVI